MKIKIVNKEKFIKRITIAILAIILITIIGINKAYSKETIEYKEEYIYSGDTLWSIAEKEAEENNYYKEEDIRSIVFDLKKVNNIENTNLEVGQKILIPTI